jgi:glycerophosphoryl diester phosphodiesterase
MRRIKRGRVFALAIATLGSFGWLAAKRSAGGPRPAAKTAGVVGGVAAWRPTIIAHRGCPGYAENTVNSILAAADRGADWIEVDVRETRDGEFVLHHDADLTEDLGLHMKIREASLAEIQARTLAGGDERVPTFAQAMQAMAGTRAKLYVHLKDGILDAATAAKLLEICRSQDFIGRVRFNSGSFTTLARLRAEDSRVWLEYDLYDAKGLLWSNDMTSADLDSIRRLAIRSVGTFSFKTTLALVRRAHLHGLLVDALVSVDGMPFHDEAAAYREMVGLGVDEIMTDDIGRYSPPRS